MSDEDKKFEPRVKTVEEAVRSLKELALKVGVCVEDDLDTSLIKLRAKVQSKADTPSCDPQSLSQPAGAQMSMAQCLDDLIALARKNHKAQ